MEKIKVDASMFGIKQPIAVAPTVRVTYKLNQLMLKALESSVQTDAPDEKQMISAITKETEFVDEAIKFIAQTLNIDEERIWDNASETGIGTYLSYLRARMNGMDEKSAQEAMKNDSEGPKLEAEKSAKEFGKSSKK